MKFGTSYSYWGNVWSCNYCEVIEKVAKIGFDMLEVGADHLYHMDDDELEKLRKLAIEYGVELVANSGPAKEYDLANKDKNIRENGISFFEKVMEQMKKIDSHKLIGAIYSFWPSDFMETDKVIAWERSIDSLKILAKKAEAMDIHISLEVLNRYETFILTDCKEAKKYCEQVGSPNIDILLDTFHMNIEEDNMAEAIRECDAMLGHFHVGEGNRKLPGMNNSIDWDAVAQALKDIAYNKGVVMEPFMISGGEVGRDIKVWRDLSEGASQEQLTMHITESLRFLKKKFL
ncbi:D-psicose/D-tagatose/L-ribulose 3-epimerase [Aequitasia blattaphilus]|uniref:Sugar phosphate isomerase/epimerase n=1 Tax=Aequitasia blattaphilus TaxID=2949332 RepID=A0ABT1E8W8_9FIRM|nr:sugar phosphate isomerase/epimerase family protein [Aequitasia blattaphilus]MCP1100957.1 sugar phosphate isomerase/epimerase [Aequitasia blattaphilus]MCR8613597.1 sugar phosphate isomerase/epimerase [Aequitasia blattaphilus]